MNQATKQTYNKDLIFQGLFYFPMMLCYFLGFLAPGAFFIGMLIQFFVGVSQVISGAFHTVRYEEEEHKRYFMIAIGYLAFLFLGGLMMSSISFGGEVLIILFLFIIPVGIATWYYRLTWLAYKDASNFTEKKPRGASYEDVLDDAML